MKKRFEVIMAVVLLVGAYFFAREGAHMVENRKALKGEICIVIDAGHGGDDPGKIGINKEKEKDNDKENDKDRKINPLMKMGPEITNRF